MDNWHSKIQISTTIMEAEEKKKRMEVKIKVGQKQSYWSIWEKEPD